MRLDSPLNFRNRRLVSYPDTEPRGILDGTSKRPETLYAIDMNTARTSKFIVTMRYSIVFVVPHINQSVVSSPAIRVNN